MAYFYPTLEIQKKLNTVVGFQPCRALKATVSVWLSLKAVTQVWIQVSIVYFGSDASKQERWVRGIIAKEKEGNQ